MDSRAESAGRGLVRWNWVDDADRLQTVVWSGDIEDAADTEAPAGIIPQEVSAEGLKLALSVVLVPKSEDVKMEMFCSKGVNGHVDVPAGGQLKVPTPCG